MSEPRSVPSKNESRLLAALQRYGTHADYCAMYKGPIEDGCNCGLFEAMGLAPDGKPLSGDGSQVETSVPLSLVKEARLYMQHDRKCWGSTHEDDCDCGFVKIAEKLKPFINGSPVETSRGEYTRAEFERDRGFTPPEKASDERVCQCATYCMANAGMKWDPPVKCRRLTGPDPGAHVRFK